MHDSIVATQTPSRPPRRSYTKKFKADAVAQCERGDRSLAQVAMDLKINANLVRRWQRELRDEPSKSKLLPVNVSNLSIVGREDHLDVVLGDVTIKVSGAVDLHRVAELVRLLR